jgi:hypothetical protein
MTTFSDRRRFLKQSAATAAVVGLGDLGPLSSSSPARAAQSKPAVMKIRFDPDTDRLAQLIQRTPRDRAIPVMVEQLRKGLSHRRFMAALLRTAMRYNQRGHQILVAHSVHQLSLDLGRKEQFLPLFWHLHNVKRSYLSNRDRPELDWIKGPLPPPDKAVALLDAAYRHKDREAVNLAIISLSRSEGPRAAFQRLWRYGSNDSSIGHTIISVSNVYRTLEAIGWQDAETALRVCATKCINDVGDLDRANAVRASQATDQMPADWASSRSVKEAVLELISMFREGRPGEACESIYQQLLSGKVHAGAVWDAIFLTTNELSVRFKWGGLLETGRSRHSITGTNALHCAFRTHSDPEVRLYALLQAVAMTCSFIAIPRADGLLNDFKITEITETEGPNSVEDAVDEIFSLLPPRRSQHAFRDRSGQDRALRLTYAMAQEHSDQRFLQTARRLLCLKSTIDPHDVKFAVAGFESYRYLSAEWRPNYLAASVFLLHGTQMEDNPAVQEAREELRSL